MKTILVAALSLGWSVPTAIPASDPLPSWNDTAPRKAIVAFVERVTRAGSPDFVPVPERIAVFDNDGCLWAEQPMYFQALFTFDRIKALAPQHPEWKTKEPFASALKGDVQSALAGGDHALLEMVMATHAGMTTTEFEEIVTDWITTAKHPTTGRLHTEMVYQPMLEWTTAGKGPRFGLLVHHDDADREWAYDRESHLGRLDRGLDEGPGRGWTIVSMKADWNTIFPYPKR